MTVVPVGTCLAVEVPGSEDLFDVLGGTVRPGMLHRAAGAPRLQSSSPCLVPGVLTSCLCCSGLAGLWLALGPGVLSLHFETLWQRVLGLRSTLTDTDCAPGAGAGMLMPSSIFGMLCRLSSTLVSKARLGDSVTSVL